MVEQASYFWIGLSAILLLLDLWALVQIFRSEASVSAKAGWSLVLILLPLIGVVAWGIAGPRGIKRGDGPTSPEHSKG
jgi:hypothetical protein